MRIAVTGHRGLPAHTARLVASVLDDELGRYAESDITGYSCLADGADTIFARAVLEHGGSLVVIVPATNYRSDLPPSHHHYYDQLMVKAARVVDCGFHESGSEAHMQASLHMIGPVDLVIAVWDGNPARGYGGTADIVAAARMMAKPVRVIWPDGAARG